MADGLGNLAEKNLRIATLNVDGIRGKKKREAIIRTLKNKCLDIVALQETHQNQNSTELKKDNISWCFSGNQNERVR